MISGKIMEEINIFEIELEIYNAKCRLNLWLIHELEIQVDTLVLDDIRRLAHNLPINK